MAEATVDARPAAGLAVLALVFNALVWGLSWWPFRRLAADGVHPLWSTAIVYAASLVVFLLWQPRALKPFAHQPLLWALAAASGLTNVGFNWAVTVGDVVRVVLLFYLMPAWSVLLAWLVLGEKPSAAGLARVALALFGVFTVLDTSASGFPWPRTLPDVLALAGGFSFALTNVLLRRLAFEPAASRSLAMFGGGTVLGAGVALLGGVQGVVASLPPPQAGWVVVAAGLALAFLCSNLALQYGAARLKAHTTALVMLSEVVFASLSSVALGAATLGTRTLLGGGLIVLAAAWSAWPRARAAGDAQ